MTWRLLLLYVAMAVGIASAAASPAASQTRAVATDFTDRMTALLVTDPAQAQTQAETEIARLAMLPAARRDGRLGAANWVLAQAKFRMGDQAGAGQLLAATEAMVPSGEAGSRLRAQVALLKGLLARSGGDFGAALRHYRQAQAGFIAAHDARGQGLSLQALGALYADVGDGRSAIRFLTLAQDVYAGDDFFLLSLNNNFGSALVSANQLQAGKDRFLIALGLSQKLGLPAYVTQIRLNIAATEIQLANFNAVRQQLAALGPIANLANPVQAREARRLAALVALRSGNIAQARRLIDQALAGVDPANSHPAFRHIHFAAYQIFAAERRARDSLVQLEAVRRLDAADVELLASNRAAVIAAQFQFAAQETRIAQLKAEQLARDVAFERSRAQFQRIVTGIIVVAALLTLGMLSALLVVANRARKRAEMDSAELSVVNQRLERALAAKTEFLASTSHEIRTPLNGILGMTQIMLADRMLPSSIRPQVQLVHDAGTTMRALVDDILDVAKIEHGGFVINPQATDISALVCRVATLFKAQAESRGIALTIGSDLPAGSVMVDPDRLTQIIFNLIGNALKFTKAGSIDVSLTLAPVPGDAGEAHQMVLKVADTGIGIAPEWHDAVFDMFRQVDQGRSRNFSGTGLGLAICRQLAEAMGGAISLSSAEGEGSTFAVALPYALAPAEQDNVIAIDRSQTDALAPAAPSLRVAVIATDPMRSAMLSTIARRSGFAVVMVDTAESLAAAQAASPVLCLVDAQALGFAHRLLSADAARPAHLIIAGAVENSEELSQFTHDSVTVVPFTRNAVGDALGTNHAAKGSDGDMGSSQRRGRGVHRSADEPKAKRATSMSRK